MRICKNELLNWVRTYARHISRGEQEYCSKFVHQLATSATVIKPAADQEKPISQIDLSFALGARALKSICVRQGVLAGTPTLSHIRVGHRQLLISLDIPGGDKNPIASHQRCHQLQAQNTGQNTHTHTHNIFEPNEPTCVLLFPGGCADPVPEH
jgi:hypothetical protein